MPTSIDETELARLEQLKEDSDNNRTVYGGDTIATVWYQSEAANAVPALISEIRRLRRNYECSEKSLQRHEHMVAELMEKVEAWRDAAEFEATVASKLTRLDAEDLPCANSMGIFCPRPPFRGRNCGPWCILRMARLDVEAEMEKHADRE